MVRVALDPEFILRTLDTKGQSISAHTVLCSITKYAIYETLWITDCTQRKMFLLLISVMHWYAHLYFFPQCLSVIKLFLSMIIYS